ncbi:peptidoglycan-recognition protein LC-like isoform X3 [Drosophila innubila]|uniref:peptidoglycan-recognition protein LC-like isoform X3 n=1 Tax=Drosophila innubila TaxID=198719 RepID=UPI00148D244A|nr:peptidoglycan-recognition protein LC-like isoform X3 [Drosophila innubila]
MHVNSETEFNANNIHIINRTSGKNCSTSSTDSGVGLVDNTATYITKNSSRKGSEETKQTYDDGEKQQKAETETDTQRISIEVEAKVNLNKKVRKTSPALSIRSTTISIVSIDEDAIDSSCIDSDSEAEPDEGCTVHKLGQQLKYPPPQSDELTQLNKGLTVISRQVLPSNGQGPPVPDAPDIVAQQLLNGSMNLATPTAPATPQQIGSIALTNTTDVTFGDKHYYEGPVTIQQILIDSREKWKAAEGQDNPAFDPQATPNATGTKSNESCEAPALCPFLPHNISRKAIIITAIFVALTIVLGIILATTTNLFGKTLNKNKDNIGGGLVLRFVPRPVWLAQPPQKQLPDLSLPVPIVILLPTNSENCSTQAQCVFRVRFLQTFNIESEHHDDIKFNFLIGGDGNVYVGRGWDIVGAHMHGYNTRSVSFAYIGTFQKQKPSSKQLNVTRLLLEDGVNLGKIAPDYKLIGASSLEPTITEYNAEQLYESFANWTHWTKVN